MTQKVICVNVQLPDCDDKRYFSQQEELKRLVETAGGEPVYFINQKREKPDHRYYVGKGKLQELKESTALWQADLVVFYASLSPTQLNNLQRHLESAVIDRVQLILDIFAQNVSNREGKLQVALAQNEYLLPRILGQGKVLSRLGGGIGTRGPGETKLESDRRILRREIQKIKHELDEVAKQRHIARSQRGKSGIFQIGLFGYTNAGKSTLINRLANAETDEQDALFATLTTLTRTFSFENHFKVSVTDTVGVIQDLPPTIIDAFHSTLEESRSVDLLLIVIDASSDYAIEQERVIIEILEEMEMIDKPHLFIYNKADRIEGNPCILYSKPNLLMSAYSPKDIKQLKLKIANQIKATYVYFNECVSAEHIGQWLSLATTIYIESYQFNEEENLYTITGYAPKWVTLP